MIGWVILGMLGMCNLVAIFIAYEKFRIKKCLEKIKIGTLLDCIHTSGSVSNNGMFIGFVTAIQFKQNRNEEYKFKITLYDIKTNIFYDLYGNLITNSFCGRSYDAIDHAKKDLIVWNKSGHWFYHRIYIEGILE